jgi:hypothetical protein
MFSLQRRPGGFFRRVVTRPPWAAAAVLLGLASAPVAQAAGPPPQHFVDTALCSFPLDITVGGNVNATPVVINGQNYTRLSGTRTWVLKNQTSGNTVNLEATGSILLDSNHRIVQMSGSQIHGEVPFLETQGTIDFNSFGQITSTNNNHPRVIDVPWWATTAR